MNAPLQFCVDCEEAPFGLLLHPPKSDDRYAQLTRGAFILNDFLQNSPFRTCFFSKFEINYLYASQKCPHIYVRDRSNLPHFFVLPLLIEIAV